MQSAFIISLDFELLWGVKDHRTIDSYGHAILGGREAILAMLDLFRKEEIHATWAVVGMLMCEDKNALLSLIPSTLPQYENRNLSNYEKLTDVGLNEQEDPFHYGSSLIRQIVTTPYQEFSSHTFSHFYCKESGQSETDFETDTLAFVNLSKERGYYARSIVFPRNQYNRSYFPVLSKLGFTSFRGNETHWLYEAKSRAEESLTRRFIRLVDGYLNISGHHTDKVRTLKKEAGLLNIPASRFFRPYAKSLFFLEPLKMNRIKASMKHAAIHGELFHLWWHPHNFGTHPQQMMRQLEEIIGYYKELKAQYGMQSMNMNEISDQYDKLNAK